jgi:hypothetical protein
LHIKTSITEDGPTPQMLISTCRSPALVYRSTTLSQTKVKKKKGRTITPLLSRERRNKKKLLRTHKSCTPLNQRKRSHYCGGDEYARNPETRKQTKRSSPEHLFVNSIKHITPTPGWPVAQKHGRYQNKDGCPREVQAPATEQLGSIPGVSMAKTEVGFMSNGKWKVPLTRPFEVGCKTLNISGLVWSS